MFGFDASSMMLAVDIGNTTCSFGVFDHPGARLAKYFSIPTRPEAEPAQLAGQIRRVAKNKRIRLGEETSAVVCSVVPRMTPVMGRALRSLGVRRITVVGKDLRVPLINRYRYPRQVGQDRLVGAYAAWCEFGDGALLKAGRNPERARKGESKDCIVADFGTAITIDVVTKAGEYLGGVIAPGLLISLEALATRTALLPRVKLKEPPELLGRDTANSIRAGLIYGCAALCDGLVAQLKAKCAPQATVVATGGASPLIAKHATTVQHLRPHLILEGLSLLIRFIL